MAITAMGLGNKAAPEGANLDPQREFWSWLEPFVNPDDKGADSGHHERGYFSGFACTQNDPAGMSIKIGGGSVADSALLVLTDGRCVLLSTNGEPELVTIPTAPATGSRIDAVVSYIDTTSPAPETETPGTPEYVHTIVVRGTASSNPSAPTDSQIVGALPAGANSKYYRWCDVKVAAGQTVITDSDITDKKPMSPNLYYAPQLHKLYGGSPYPRNETVYATAAVPAGMYLLSIVSRVSTHGPGSYGQWFFLRQGSTTSGAELLRAGAWGRFDQVFTATAVMNLTGGPYVLTAVADSGSDSQFLDLTAYMLKIS